MAETWFIPKIFVATYGIVFVFKQPKIKFKNTTLCFFNFFFFEFLKIQHFLQALLFLLLYGDFTQKRLMMPTLDYHKIFGL